MRLERFNVTAIDEFGGRVAEVRTDQDRFETPTRAATSTEYNYKGSLGIETPFENRIGEWVARYNRNDIEAFTTRNGSYASRLRTAAANANRMRFVVSKCYPQSPYDHPLDENTIRLMLDLQLEAGLDLVTIPHSIDEEPRLLDHYRRWAAYAEQYASRLGESAIAVPHVPMRLDEELFQSTMRELWDERATFPVVGLTFYSIGRYKINYNFLRNHRDQDTWLHMSQVPRAKYRGTNADVSGLHQPQIYGVDTVSTVIPWGGTAREPPENYHFIRYFDYPTLSVPRIDRWIGHRETEATDCPCPICRERTFPEIADEFTVRQEGAIDLQPLFGAFRLHEVFRSSNAFDEGRVFISENDFAQYLTDRIGSAIDEHLPE